MLRRAYVALRGDKGATGTATAAPKALLRPASLAGLGHVPTLYRGTGMVGTALDNVGTALGHEFIPAFPAMELDGAALAGHVARSAQPEFGQRRVAGSSLF